MPSREQGRIEVMDEHAGVSTRTKRPPETSAPEKGISGVPEEEEEPKSKLYPELPLKKSGERREVRWTQQWEKDVRELSEKHPAHFRALHSLVEGRAEEVTERQYRDLRAWGYLAHDRSPLPGVKAVMEAAYRETMDGPCIVNPLDVKTPADADTLRLAEEQLDEMREQGLKRLHRRLFDEDEGEDKGLPR